MSHQRKNVKIYKPKNRTKRSDSVNGNATTSKRSTIALALSQRSGVMRIPKNRFAPDCVLVELSYPDTVLTRTNPSSSYLSWRYRINSAYDPDPALVSGAIPGFAFWAAGYTAYRVLSSSYSIDICNFEASAVDIVAAPSLVDLGLNYSGTNELFGNPYASQALLSPSGGMDRARLKGTLDLGVIWGNCNELVSSASFGSGVTANPSQPIYLNIGGVCSATFTLNKGLDYRCLIKYTVLFYQRRILTT